MMLFYSLDKDQTEIIYEYKYLGLIIIHLITLSHLVKGEEMHV